MKRAKQESRLRVTNCVCHRAESDLVFETTLSNAGAVPVFVTENLRRMQMEGKTLHLWFSDHGACCRPTSRFHRQFTVPETLSIQPGEEKTLSARLPQLITRLVPGDRESLELEAIELMGATKVIVHIAVSDTPFYFNPNEPNIEQQLRDWSTDVTAEVERERWHAACTSWENRASD